MLLSVWLDKGEEVNIQMQDSFHYLAMVNQMMIQKKLTGRTGKGLVILLGITHADTMAEVRWFFPFLK